MQILLHTFCTIIVYIALFCMCAAFALLIDKAAVLCNCKFCSCNKANACLQMQNATIPLSTPSYLIILLFLARQSGFAPLRTVHSLVLVSCTIGFLALQLNCCIQHYSACLPAILAHNLHHFSSTYLGFLDNLQVYCLFWSHLKHFPVNFPNSIGTGLVLGLLRGCCCCGYIAGA